MKRSSTSSSHSVYGDFCHALQNPLCVIVHSLEILEQSSPPPPKRVCSRIRKSVEKISTSIESFLGSMYCEENTPCPSETFCIDAELEKTIEYVRVIAESKNITLISFLQSAVYFYGNTKRLEELFLNILSNAIRYTEHAPIRTITITLKETFLGITILIHDSGSGISAEHLPHIFERFYTTRTTQSIGHGLGLSIAKQIVTEHFGYISIVSPKDHGTFVSIRFPHTQQ